MDQLVHVHGSWLRSGEARESGEFVYELAKALDRARDGFSRAVDDGERGRFGNGTTVEMFANTFRGKQDRRQWVLDLMRNAAGHLAPCRLFLCFQQLAQILEDHDVAEARF